MLKQMISLCVVMVVSVVLPNLINPIEAHNMHMMADSSTTIGYKCPACEMDTYTGGYENKNFVKLTNGQKIYICGMAPRSFQDYDGKKFTDVEYVAANMAEFIKSNDECKDSECKECGSGSLKDPISGDEIPSKEYKFVCLEGGQKIYFASEKTRTEYLTNVNSDTHYQVDSMTCKDDTCPDESTIQTLSTKAQSFSTDAFIGSTSSSGSARTITHRCPVCNMDTQKNGYNNENFVSLTNGQTIYTCGMDPRPFDGYDGKHTDTEYLAANMAQYVVFEKSEDFECTTECDGDCTSGKLKDPLNGEIITKDNFKFVCLTNKQKIYFASSKTRSEYLNSINKQVHFKVEEITCKGTKCSDALSIKTLSQAAKDMKPDEASSSSSDTASSTSEETNGFCSGGGTVMFNGFQSTVGNSCIRLFFQPWVLNTGVKYFFGFIGVFGMALLNEYLVKFRERIRQDLLAKRRQRRMDKAHKYKCKAILALLYMVQMTIAYFAMLVVMIYDTGLFLALIFGFGAGFLFFKSFDMDVSNEKGVWRFIDPTTICLRVEGMSCMANCGTTVEKALEQVPGVTRAFMEFDEKCAYVAGTADYHTLIEAVEAVGFTAELMSHPAGGQHPIGPNKVDGKKTN